MSRTKGTFSLTSNIEPKVGAPLDARTIVKLKTDLMASGTFDYPYIGLTVFVEEENKKYTLIGLDPTVSANWIEESAGVQSDWNEDDTSDLSYIKNKPENLVQDANYVHTDNNYDDTSKGKVDALGTASTKDVPASGDASITQVVMGNDTRLSDARPASDVYSWAKASTKPTYTASEVGAIATTLKGTANGVAELDDAGKVPSSQLPSFVDDVIEVADYDHLPITGESGKIYVTLDTNKTYRWTGSGYAEISESLALGETSSTAYRGDRGKTAYDHATETKLSTATASGLYKVASTAQGHIASLTAVEKADITALGIPGSDTNDTVTQTNSTGNAGYRVLFSLTNDDTTRTEGARKAGNLIFNPGVGVLLSDYFGSSANITARLTSLNFEPMLAVGTGRTAERLDLVSSSATGVPPAPSGKTSAGFTHTYYWDTGGSMTQVYIPNGDHLDRNGPQGIMMRGYDSQATTPGWQNWEYIPFMKTAPTSGQVIVADGAVGGIKTSGYTIAKSVPSDAVFTDTNNAVTQTNLANTDTNSRRLLLSNSANDTSETKGVYKNTQLQYTPSTGTLTLPKVNQKILQLAKTGTGTAAQDKGSGVSPRYFPSRWTFDFGYAPSDGDIITITIPVASHTWGNWLSIDNGTTYYPVNINYGTTRLTTHFGINNIIQLVFDADGSTASMTPVNGADSVNGSTITGGCWRVINFYDSNTDIRPSAYCDTAAATAAKAASCTNYNLLSKSYLHVLMVYANSSASAITLNVNSKGAKPIYINGTASSASNYTLPAGTYLVYYDGTNYYFRTDGKITGDITGNAATVNGLTVQTAVPANAVFTDTNTKVTQTNSTANGDYRLLLSANANDTTETNTSIKSTNFKANPSTGLLTVKQSKSTVDKSMLTGTGTAAQDKGSGVSPRYFPAKWTFNTGITVADGDMFTIKIPVAGHSYGEFISVNNGTNYYPVGYNTNTLLTTHFPVGAIITVVFKSDGVINSIYPVAGGDAKVNVSGGAFYVLDLYDSGNSNTYDRNRYNAAIKAWGTALVTQNIIVANTSGLYMHLKQNAAFDITYPILYLAENVAASATTTNTYDIINFATATTQSGTWTAYKPVFIKGQLSGTTFTPVSATPLTQTIPTTADGYEYILLGIATATTTVYLQERHPIYAYQNGAFREYNYVFDALGIAENTSF